MAAPLWNSLEVVKLVVGALTPLTVAIVAALLAWRSTRVGEQRASAAEAEARLVARYTKAVEKRVALWDELGPCLNTIFAFILEVGDWQRTSAADIIRAKRKTDQVFHSYRPFFTDDFATAYQAFMAAAFRIFNAPGQDAKIRATNQRHNDPEAFRFTGEENEKPVFKAYYHLLEVVGAELDLVVTPPLLASVKKP